MNSRLVSIGLGIIFLFLLWLVVKDYPQKAEVSRQLNDVKTKLESLTRDEARQKSLAEYLSSESYLEKQARIRLNLKKEGEEVVFIYKKEEPETGKEDNKNENPFLLKLKEWIKMLWIAF
ncbi:MAG: septum formation initiator family protein [Patescibacteria group bacterium]